MREILFRGKQCDNGEWVVGSLWLYGESAKIFGCLDFPDGADWYEVDPSTVSQFTGLYDKNGKRIWEGDVIKYGSRILTVWWNGEMFQWQAKEKNAFGIYSGRIDDTDWSNIDLGWIAAEVACIGRMTTEVIGNKWDNPELLGGDGNAR